MKFRPLATLLLSTFVLAGCSSAHKPICAANSVKRIYASSVKPAEQAPYPVEAYTLKYVFESNASQRWVNTSTTSWNGKGKIVSVSGSEISVSDYAKLSRTRQLNFRTPLRTESLSPGFDSTNEQMYLFYTRRSRPKTEVDKWWATLVDNRFESLGERLIDGHHCNGWMTTIHDTPGVMRHEVWFDKTSGVRVLEEDSGVFHNSSRLISARPEALPAAAFELPVKDPAVWAALTGEEESHRVYDNRGTH